LEPGDTASLAFSSVAKAYRDSQNLSVHVVASEIQNDANEGASAALQILTASTVFSVPVEFDVLPERLLLYVPQGERWEAQVYLVPTDGGTAELTGITFHYAGWSGTLAPRRENGVSEARLSGLEDGARRDYFILETDHSGLPKMGLSVVIVPVPKLFAVPSGAVLRSSGDGKASISMTVFSEFERPNSEGWRVEFDANSTGAGGELRWQSLNATKGEIGKVEGTLNSLPAGQLGRVFEMAARVLDSEGKELIRLPIIVY